MKNAEKSGRLSYRKVGERDLAVDLDTAMHLPLKLLLAQFVRRDAFSVEEHK